MTIALDDVANIGAKANNSLSNAGRVIRRDIEDQEDVDDMEGIEDMIVNTWNGDTIKEASRLIAVSMSELDDFDELVKARLVSLATSKCSYTKILTGEQD